MCCVSAVSAVSAVSHVCLGPFGGVLPTCWWPPPDGCCACFLLWMSGALQEVWYQLSFEGYPESDAEWFPASRIRAEHPQGDELIAAFDKGLEASGQGDVALPPHAAERAAALTVGTPQVGVYARSLRVLFQGCLLRAGIQQAVARDVSVLPATEGQWQCRLCRHLNLPAML